MSRRLRHFGTIMEQTLIAECAGASSLPVAPRPAIPLPRLRPEDEVGVLWDRVRESDSRRVQGARALQDCLPA